MKSRIVNLVSILLLVSSMFLVNQSTPVLAYSSAPVDMSAPDYQTEGADTIGFYQIRPTDIQLIGPYDETSLAYGLPADWSLNGSPTLNLELSVAISSLSGFVANDINSQVISVGGTLTVEYNREVVGTFPFTQNGDFSKTVQIPLELTKSVRDDGRQELVFILDSGFSCLLNQQMTVTVHTSSNITYSHTSVLPDTNLARYPFPIYQGSIFPDQALIVLPDKPTAEELQSAMIISAGLGKLSNLRMTLDLTTAGKLTTEQTLSQNLILVGKGSEFSILDGLPLPMPVTSGKFQTQAERVDDGIVQMVNSPWNKGRVVLLVSGDTNAAVIKSAKALSTGVLRSNTSSNLSIVQDVQASEIQNMPSKNDVTLAELGYENAMLERRGVDVATFRFFVPSGTTLDPDAYFEMFFGNSALLDFARSGLVVQVNGQPVGSVRFSETTAAEAMNRLQINIPSSVVISGINTLDVVSSLQPIDNCSAPNLRGLWATIWSDSRLHIPLIPSLTVATPVLSLSDFPAPFVFDSSLGNTAFVLQRDDLESWSSALEVAAYLGERSDGAIISLNTYFADDIPESERADKNFIVMGLAPQMPIMTELNELLPAPFESQSGIATENNMQVTFRIPANSPVGYVELLQSPWNKNNIIIVSVGNLRQGTSSAIASLYTSSLRSRLAGNFAVINDQQVTTADTRISIPQIAISSTAPDLSLIPPLVDTTIPVAIERPAWILPALLFAIGMVALILIVVIINVSRHNKKGYPTPSPVEKSKEENTE